jgi:hypothetical protein
MMSQFEPEKSFFEREMVILEEIQKNPELHHNALIRKIVPKYMAKSTFERTRDKLIEKNVLSCNFKGNRKFYQMTERYEIKSMQIIERITISNFQRIKHEIKRMDDDFHHKDVSEKIQSYTQLLRELLQTDNGLTLLDSIKNSKKTLYKDEHLEIQEMISFVFQCIARQKDSEIIFSTVISCIGSTFSKSFDQ